MFESIQNLRLRLKPGHESWPLPIFQQGFYLRARAGLPMAKILEEVGFSRKYLEEKAQTVFLDGSAVDDLDRTLVEGDSVIALSGAMPGLVGAILRKGSPIAALRSKTGAETGPRSAEDTVYTLRLKLFNTIVEEMGPGLLHRGILLKGSDLNEFLSGRRELLEEALLEAELDGARVSLAELLGGNSIRSNYVAFQIISHSSSV
jgi:hypothetical protein